MDEVTNKKLAEAKKEIKTTTKVTTKTPVETVPKRQYSNHHNNRNNAYYKTSFKNDFHKINNEARLAELQLSYLDSLNAIRLDNDDENKKIDNAINKLMNKLTSELIDSK